jgi:hypothetical protein
MSNNSPISLSFENQSFYDIESDYSSQDSAIESPNNNIINDNNISRCNKILIFNRTIYFLFILSISFIIYEHYESILFYLHQIYNIF